MVKDEMVKQGRSRGTGRPGKSIQHNSVSACRTGIDLEFGAAIYTSGWTVLAEFRKQQTRYLLHSE